MSSRGRPCWEPCRASHQMERLPTEVRCNRHCGSLAGLDGYRLPGADRFLTTCGANETGSLENQLLESVLPTCFSWAQEEVDAAAFRFFLPAGCEGPEYLEIARARRLANVAQLGLARLTQA